MVWERNLILFFFQMTTQFSQSHIFKKPYLYRDGLNHCILALLLSAVEFLLLIAVKSHILALYLLKEYCYSTEIL